MITPVTRPRPQVSGIQFQNHPADAVIRGGEVELRSNFTSGVTGFINYAHQSDEQTSEGTDTAKVPIEFAYSPKNKVNIGAYGGPFDGVRAAVEASWKGNVTAPRQWARVAGLPPGTTPVLHSYTLVNARVSYDIPLHRGGANQPLRLTLFGNNLLDKRAVETLIGVNTALAGREFFAQVELHF